MNSNGERPCGVHLVGSVPLTDTEAVFRAVSGVLGAHVRRMPDGETGERTNWVTWQWPVLAKNPAFEMRIPGGVMRAMLWVYSRVPLVRGAMNRRAAQSYEQRANAKPLMKIRNGVRPEEISIGPLGYAACARKSYATFSRLKAAGVVPRHVRFQVSLPTPFAPLVGFATAEIAIVLPRYEQRLLAEVDEIVSAIPPDELAIQWDVAVEFGILEGGMASPFGSSTDTLEPIAAMLVRIGNRVPPVVELGYHLCYGDAGHKHFKDPRDTQLIVRVINTLAAGLKRPMNWVHFPVPRGRDDAAYFAPLSDLRVGQNTEIYAGLVHFTDGVEGGRRRIAAARRALGRDFGIGTECGMGRRQPSTIQGLLRIHAELAAPIAQASVAV